MGALTDGDSSVCSTVDYQPPEPEVQEEEEEEPDPVEPEACFTDSMNHLHIVLVVSVTRKIVIYRNQKFKVRKVVLMASCGDWTEEKSKHIHLTCSYALGCA